MVIHRHKSVINASANIIDFPNVSVNSVLFKFKLEITCDTGADGTKDVGIMVPLKYLSKLWRTL